MPGARAPRGGLPRPDTVEGARSFLDLGSTLLATTRDADTGWTRLEVDLDHDSAESEMDAELVVIEAPRGATWTWYDSDGDGQHDVVLFAVGSGTASAAWRATGGSLVADGAQIGTALFSAERFSAPAMAEQARSVFPDLFRGDSRDE